MSRILQVCAMAIAVLFGATGQSQAANPTAGDTQTLFKNLMSGAKDVCAKGSFFSGKITIRSFEGKLCKNKAIAAIATIKCASRSDFAGSHCGKNAKALLGQLDKAHAKTVLQEEMKKGSKMAKAAFSKFYHMVKGKKKTATHEESADVENADIDVGGGDDTEPQDQEEDAQDEEDNG